MKGHEWFCLEGVDSVEHVQIGRNVRFCGIGLDLNVHKQIPVQQIKSTKTDKINTYTYRMS